MKRYKVLALSMIGVLAFALPAFAATGSTSTGGAQVVIDDSTTAPDDNNLTFNPSPGVVMAWRTKANSFALTATNTSAGTDDRNEYGVASNYSGYYQTPEATGSASAGAADAPADWNAATETPTDTNFSGWSAMGGSS